jgi:hypothetical protein
VNTEGNLVPEQRDLVHRGFVRHGFGRSGVEQPSPEQRGFTTEDILWAVGIWSTIIFLSPMIVFYMMMVA